MPITPGQPVLIPGRVPLVPIQPGLIRSEAVDGVFEGGGALGTAYVGALRALEDSNVSFARVAGNSAGAITAAMVAAGFTAREIESLSSGFAPSGSMPKSLTDRGITEPISFSSFLDLPTADTISDANKRKTILWHALNGTALDVIGDIPVPTLSQEAAVDACVSAVRQTPLLGDSLNGLGLMDDLRSVLNSALSSLPDGDLHLRSFLPDTKALRRAWADNMWDAFAAVYPTMAMLTNLVYEGGIFEGEKFHATFSRLLGRKIHNNPNATVLFSQLPVPLAVIATNIDTGLMEIYSSARNPSMVVADAVRQSMSIPFFFQPDGSRGAFVDGGLCSNFPVWLFTGAGQSHWPGTSVDDTRLKIGFLLDETAAPPQTDQRPARFPVSGNPPAVDVGAALRPLLKEKLTELGYPGDVVDTDLSQWFGGTVNGQQILPEMEIVDQLWGVLRSVLGTEESTRRITTRALMDGMPYLEIAAPLLGYHALDFAVNEDRAKVRTMWDRAWREARLQLAKAKAVGKLPSRVKLDGAGPSPFS